MSGTWPLHVANDKGRRATARKGVAAPISAVIDRRALLLAGAGLMAAPNVQARPADPMRFAPLSPSMGAVEAAPPGYRRTVLLRWGDPLWSDAPGFDPTLADPKAAERQFGYNNDYTALLPHPSCDPERGLLVVNHEYPAPELMFPNVDPKQGVETLSVDQIRLCMAACGMTVAEVARTRGRWRVVLDSVYNRRITATTPIRISGPAAGHRKMRTSADPSGTWVLGTHDNCNGGRTPWGTILSCEEGSADFFGGDWRRHPEPERMARGYYADLSPEGRYGWVRADRRFDIAHEPNESNRFEWVVEIDPLDPEAPPVKRTALGRFAHEGAHCALAADGRVVVYLGDDWEYEYCYRFVSKRAVDLANRPANRDLLDEGVLSVARFSPDGSVEWLPLVFGQGPLTPANGFRSQGDVLIETRRAADLLGATPMDSPEGYEPHPLTGRVYVALTGAGKARPKGVNAANPRADNEAGHILELIPPDATDGIDHAADRFGWSIFALCGDPGAPGSGARFHPQAGAEDWFEAPDNLAFDAAGRMWVCTDGPGSRGHDGLWVMDVAGERAAWPKLFYSPPAGAECCSPAFARGGRSVFVSIQHPGDRQSALLPAGGWPDFKPGVPPRPSVVVIEREDGAPL